MKMIIAGSRTFTNYAIAKEAIESVIRENNLTITEVVSGMARGADMLGVQWAKEVGLPFTPFYADWIDFSEPCVVKRRKDGTMYNALAGFKRNRQMALYADILLALWDGISTGTKNMVEQAHANGLLVFERRVVIPSPPLPPIYKNL